jgi:DHA1 family bicyclomycin/chloramphenicol resistance-like MFS transporter
VTSNATADAAPMTGAPIHFVEFVALVAAMMSLTALGIDSMLPSLPDIGRSLHVTDPNAPQFVITAFVTGLGVGQLMHGPPADRYGRRRLLICALSAYIVCNIACAVSASFALLLTARVLGGMSIAATRVAIVAMVRDCYHGRAMARVMSIAFMVFMIVPVIAPTFGFAVVQFASWRMVFWIIAGITLAVLTWFAVRMPETLHAEDRMPMSVARVLGGWRMTLADRWSLGYTLASAALMGALYGYLNSIEQITAETFGRPKLLTVIFATTAGTMAVANLLNARLVMRLGTRLISHGAVATLIVLNILHLAAIALGLETLVVFAVLQALTMGCFGLATSNFSAMAMENMGHVAGIASSVQGFVSITFGALIGVVIGQSFNGSAVPLVTGFLVAGLAAFTAVAITERGRLFRPL